MLQNGVGWITSNWMRGAGPPAAAAIAAYQLRQ
jgi:hypothetical protein